MSFVFNLGLADQPNMQMILNRDNEVNGNFAYEKRSISEGNVNYNALFL